MAVECCCTVSAEDKLANASHNLYHGAHLKPELIPYALRIKAFKGDANELRLCLPQGEVDEEVVDPALPPSITRRHSTSVDRMPASQMASAKAALARRHSVDFLSHEGRPASVPPELPALVILPHAQKHPA